MTYILRNYSVGMCVDNPSLYQPNLFFDLTTCCHSELFDPSKPVWTALDRLPSYLNSLTLGVIEGEVSEAATLVHPELISIGPGSIIEAGAYIKGPCVIGADCEVRHGAYIRGVCLVGNRCVIGHTTEVKHSILLDGAKAAHFAYLGNTILGLGVNLGAGTRCANLRFDSGEVHMGTERIGAGTRKMGAIIGDRAQTGCNVVTAPGALIGPDVWCYPGAVVAGEVPAGAHVRAPRSSILTPTH